ncbi:MAG TPA: putative porin [Puia sp.]|nr:putative porin [Puia sp.]
MKGHLHLRLVAGFLLVALLSGTGALAQNPLGRFGNMGGGGGGGKGDSLQHRKEDTITINFRYLDSSRYEKLDSSIYDLGNKIPRPNSWINLGNFGTAAKSLVFNPRMLSGWDPGWHSYDLYLFTTEETRFFHTTKPYTEMGYMLASRAEQYIDIFHTQNIRPNWNFAFEYRLVNAPGSFQNQNSNHNDYRLNSWYQSRSKRYQNFFILVASHLNASENGGITNPKDLDSTQYSNQNTLPVYFGQNLVQATGNPFQSLVTTGMKYNQTTFLMRQQYDLGQKDSIVTDSSVIPLFYPRLRLEHTIAYSAYNYIFKDFYTPGVYTLDSGYYENNLGMSYVGGADTVIRQDMWHNLSNDLSVYTFPDAHNPHDFLKLGATLELLKGKFDTSQLYSSKLITSHRVSDQNVFAHAEYRNKTRNQKWDIEAYGRLYLSGLDAGDYNGYISLRRLISRNLGYFQAGFENSNRTPGFVFDRASSFNIDTTAKKQSFLKENTTHLFASLDVPQHQLSLTGSYYLLSNYAYFTKYYQERQEGTLFNILQITLRKQFTLYRHWKWRTLTTVQQATSSSVHVPLVVSNNQVGYDGNFGFHNLNISFGTEVRFISSYKADGYSPVTDQFYTQNSVLSQKLPDINLYLHLRIRSFTAYVQGENMNAIALKPRGFGWYNNNFVAPGYPEQALIIRVGIFWGFIN